MINIEALQKMEATEQKLEWCCPIPHISSFVTCFGCTMTR